MPRGKKSPRKGPTQSQQIAQFAARVEEATPKWLDAFEERHAVLTERFHEKDDDGKYVASVAEQGQLHKTLSLAEASVMRFAVIREQVAKEKGVSHFMERDSTTNNLTLNFAPGMSPEQRAYAEKLYLASMSGKEVDAPPLVLPAVAEVRETV